MNFKMIISYDGTRYQGWQRLKDSDMTIQGKLETILARLLDKETEVVGQGRTDAGVHAKAQVANFWVTPDMFEKTKVKARLLDAGISDKDLELGFEDDKHVAEMLFAYINHYLPEDIAVISIESVDERFHSRYLAKEKWYRYRLLNSAVSNVFERKYVYQRKSNYDLGAIREAASYLVGEYDFAAFTTAKKTKKSTVRNIYSIDVKEISVPGGSELVFDFKGDGFLYNMIRIIAGTLIEVGEGKRKPTEIMDILDEGIREKAGFLAPASGLCLMEVRY